MTANTAGLTMREMRRLQELIHLMSSDNLLPVLHSSQARRACLHRELADWTVSLWPGRANSREIKKEM